VLNCEIVYGLTSVRVKSATIGMKSEEES